MTCPTPRFGTDPGPSSVPTPSLAPGMATPADLSSRLPRAEDLPGSWARRSLVTSPERTDLDPCGGTVYPAERTRDGYAAGSYEVVEPGGARLPEGPVLVDAVSHYPSEAAAGAVAAGYRRAVGGCPTHVEGSLEISYTVLSTSPYVVERNYRSLTGDPVAAYPDHVGYAVDGSTVAVWSYSGGEGGDRPGAKVVGDLVRAALAG